MSGEVGAGDIPVVIVGGEMAADAACRGVRSVDGPDPDARALDELVEVASLDG